MERANFVPALSFGVPAEPGIVMIVFFGLVWRVVAIGSSLSCKSDLGSWGPLRWFLRFLVSFLVARGLRILQDFAGICRGILLKVFRVSTGWVTHNP